MSSSTTPEQSSPPFKLILHCEDGSPPYLTPILLAKNFPTTNRVVRDHLVLGIEVRNSFVSPVYGPRPSDRKNGRKKEKDEKSPPASRQGSNISNNDSAMSSVACSITKPTGYTFSGRPLFKHLGIPNDYDVMACPSFDLIDNCVADMPVAATNAETSLSTPRGYQRITPELYRDVVRKMEAPSFVGLYDQASSVKNTKRARRSVERTKSWLRTTISDNVTDKEEEVEGEKTDPCPKMWAPVVGEEDMVLRLECIQHAINQKAPLRGFALIGIHHVGDRQARNTLLQSCMKDIPRNMSCAVLVANDMVQILDAARNGVRYIGSALPTNLARYHKALVLDLYGWRRYHENDEGERQRVSMCRRIEERSTLSDGCISLDDDIFVKDTVPFVKDCSCLACTHHNRAYVHHLINANELLAQILLFVHNLHHVLAFYDEMSQATSMEKQDIFIAHIEKQLMIRNLQAL